MRSLDQVSRFVFAASLCSRFDVFGRRIKTRDITAANCSATIATTSSIAVESCGIPVEPFLLLARREIIHSLEIDQATVNNIPTGGGILVVVSYGR